jgi:hypothetical protein
MHKSHKNQEWDLGRRGVMQGFFMIGAFCAFLWRILAFVGGDSFREGVAVDAEDEGGLREVLLVAREGLFYVELFEFGEGLIEKDVALEHFVYEAFESGMNQSSFPVNKRYASR